MRGNYTSLLFFVFFLLFLFLVSLLSYVLIENVLASYMCGSTCSYYIYMNSCEIIHVTVYFYFTWRSNLRLFVFVTNETTLVYIFRCFFSSLLSFHFIFFCNRIPKIPHIMNDKKFEWKKKHDGIYDAEELNARKRRFLIRFVYWIQCYSQLVQKTHTHALIDNDLQFRFIRSPYSNSHNGAETNTREMNENKKLRWDAPQRHTNHT